MQNNLFDFPKFQIEKKIRLITLFSGIGSQEMAMRDIGANFEIHFMCEFDKYAVQSYNAIHGTNFKTSDIRNIHGSDLKITDKDKYCYLMTYSFPCTDLSVAGKMKGMSKAEWEQGNSTRSGLLWEVERILKELKADELPQVLLMENVPQVHAEQNRADFEVWLAFLRSRGYFNFYQDLNAKDYGIPQNRDRCFCVSILSPDFIDYEFPEPVKLEKVMRDYLEDQVDEKYYLNTKKAELLIEQLVEKHNNSEKFYTVDLSLKNPRFINNANCITARNDRSVSNLEHEGNGVIVCCAQLNYKRLEKINNKIAKCIEARDSKGFNTGYSTQNAVICRMTGRNPDNPKSRKPGLPTEQMLEPNAQGICGALMTVQKDNLVLEGNAFFMQAIKTAEEGNAEPGNIIDAFNHKVIKNGISPTITTRPEGKKTAILPCVQYKTTYRIRKLTPRECWRLMGYTDTDFDKANEVNSATQLYKQAGNAIVKQVLMAIFAQMIPESARKL